MPRFPETFCSNCGGAFGPGDSGFSHCRQHSHLQDLEKEPMSDRQIVTCTNGHRSTIPADALRSRQASTYSCPDPECGLGVPASTNPPPTREQIAAALDDLDRAANVFDEVEYDGEYDGDDEQCDMEER